MTPKLELRDVLVRRGRRTTLSVERLAIEPGHVVAVIGPNGAGKTTLVQVAGLLLRPDEGEVLFDGAVVTGDALAYRRRMAFAMQEAILIDGSVVENAALGLKLRGVSARGRRERALRWLDRFGIADLASRPARRLSGGEAQRTSLARAFATEPEVLLLDEPFGGLDQPLRQTLLDDLASVLSDTGVTTVFVTHDRNEALRLADRTAVLLDGVLRQAGPTSEVFQAPVDENVAAFVGMENILPARVLSVGEGAARVQVGDRVVVARANGVGHGDALLCLRPEDVLLQSAEDEAGGRNHLEGTVVEVRPRGVEAWVKVECGSFALIATAPKLTLEELGLRPGLQVAASFRESAVHLLAGRQSPTPD